MYFAIIGDIIDSKSIKDRWSAQKNLEQALNAANSIYFRCLESKLTITLGDEFQGLFNNANQLLEIMDQIRYRVHPINLRFGIGIGNMSTEIVHEKSMGSDGPAYWAAREAIQYVHDKNDYGNSSVCVRLFHEKEAPNQMIDIINSTLRLCDRIEKSWTQSQYAFVREVILKYKYGNEGEYYQREIAKEFGISPQMVNSKVKNTGLATYVEARRSIEKLLQSQWGDQSE